MILGRTNQIQDIKHSKSRELLNEPVTMVSSKYKLNTYQHSSILCIDTYYSSRHPISLLLWKLLLLEFIFRWH